MNTSLSSMIVTLALAAASAEVVVLEPRAVTLDVIESEGFPAAHRLPETPNEATGRDWVGEWREALASERCGALTVGDVIARVHGLRDDPAALAAELDRLLADCPDRRERWAGSLLELLKLQGLRSESWNPAKNLSDDGILQGPRWDISRIGTEPWRSLKGSDDLFQSAVLIFADLEAVKAAENDYPTYPQQVGTTYEAIYPIADKNLVVREEVDGVERTVASSLQLHFRCDLPFPFDSYSCDLDILNTVNRHGELVTDIWTDSRDFYWMAGRDVFLPIFESDGSFVCLLLIRQFGFDLRGVPDGTDARLEGLRCSLGNLVRRAEARYAEWGGPPRTVRGALPAFDVLR